MREPQTDQRDPESVRAHRRFVGGLAVVFGLWSFALGIEPVSRSAWLLENLLTVALIATLAASYRALPLSRTSYGLIFAFLMVHEVGSHYTYSEVPYDSWFAAMTGRTISDLTGWERNHFDRLVHLLYGLMLAYPIREVFLRVAAVRGFWGYFLPLDLTMSTSMVYELIEWAAATLFGGDLGIAYLGTQGDVWDAHHDMALASLGALLAMLATATFNRFSQRDFAAEWAESLRVKSPLPLDEEGDAMRYAT